MQPNLQPPRLMLHSSMSVGKKGQVAGEGQQDPLALATNPCLVSRLLIWMDKLHCMCPAEMWGVYPRVLPAVPQPQGHKEALSSHIQRVAARQPQPMAGALWSQPELRDRSPRSSMEQDWAWGVAGDGDVSQTPFPAWLPFWEHQWELVTPLQGHTESTPWTTLAHNGGIVGRKSRVTHPPLPCQTHASVSPS